MLSIRHKVRFLTTAVLMVSSCGVSTQDQEPSIVHGPYLQQLTDSSVIVVWHTNVEATSWVEYGTRSDLESFPVQGSAAHTARNSRHGLIDAYTKLHQVVITGLEPGQEYRYRIFSKLMLDFKRYKVKYGETIASEVFSFTTLDNDKGSFSFAVLGDIHGNKTRLESMLSQFSWEHVDLVFFNGDLLDYYDDESQIMDGFLDVSVRHFAKEVPLILVRGNHETLGKSARKWIEHFPTSSGRFYYSFDHGPVHFIILDSGVEVADSHRLLWGLADSDRYRAEQAEWLRHDIASEAFADAAFTIVLFHIPIFGAGGAHGAIHAREMWNDILNDAGVDLVLNAHLHRFLHREPTGGENLYHAVVSGANTLARVDVSAESLSVAVTEADGKVVDRLSILAQRR